MLEWQLKNWKKLQRLDQFRKMKDGGAHVPFLENEPRIDPQNTWLMMAFSALSGQRIHIDGRPVPIQISELSAYADYVGITDEADREDLLHVITKLDTLVPQHSSEARSAQMREEKRRQAAESRKTRRRRR